MPGSEPYWIETFARVAETGEAEQIERWHEPTDRWVHSSTARVGGAGSTRLVSVFYDISERKRAELALRESEQRLASELEATRRLHETSTQLIHEENVAAVYDAILEAAIAISGSDFGNIQLLDPSGGDLRIVTQRGFPPWWLSFWDSVAKGQGTCGTALERGERIVVEDVERSPTFVGTPALDIQLRAGVRAVQSTPLISRSGKPVGMLSTHCRKPGRPEEHVLRLLDLLARQAADLIEQKRAEAALRESDEKYRTVFESMDQGFVIHELIRAESGRVVDTRLLDANPASLRLSGLPREAIGKLGSEYAPSREGGWHELFHRVSTTGLAERTEMYNASTSRWYNVQILPVTGQDRVALVLDDVTARKQAELALKSSGHDHHSKT